MFKGITEFFQADVAQGGIGAEAFRCEMSERRERQNWATRFNNLLSRTESRNTTVYEFNRADAYEPEVPFAV